MGNYLNCRNTSKISASRYLGQRWISGHVHHYCAGMVLAWSRQTGRSVTAIKVRATWRQAELWLVTAHRLQLTVLQTTCLSAWWSRGTWPSSNNHVIISTLLSRRYSNLRKFRFFVLMSWKQLIWHFWWPLASQSNFLHTNLVVKIHPFDRIALPLMAFSLNGRTIDIYTQIPCFRFTLYGMMRPPLNLPLNMAADSLRWKEPLYCWEVRSWRSDI